MRADDLVDLILVYYTLYTSLPWYNHTKLPITRGSRSVDHYMFHLITRQIRNMWSLSLLLSYLQPELSNGLSLSASMSSRFRRWNTVEGENFQL